MRLLQFMNEFSYGIYTGLYHHAWIFRKSSKKVMKIFIKSRKVEDPITSQNFMPLEVLAVGYGRTGTVCCLFIF